MIQLLFISLFVLLFIYPVDSTEECSINVHDLPSKTKNIQLDQILKSKKCKKASFTLTNPFNQQSNENNLNRIWTREEDSLTRLSQNSMMEEKRKNLFNYIRTTKLDVIFQTLLNSTTGQTNTLKKMLMRNTILIPPYENINDRHINDVISDKPLQVQAR